MKLNLILGGFAFGVLAASVLNEWPLFKNIGQAAQDAGAKLATH